MRTFAQRQNRTQNPVSSSLARPNKATLGRAHREHPILYLQRTIGNQSVLRMVQTNAGEFKAGLSGTASSRFGHDFGRVPMHSPASGAIQTKLAIDQPGDEYELEAERLANQVMRMLESQLQRTCAGGGGCPKCQTEQPGQEHKHLQTKRVQSSDTEQLTARPIVDEVKRSLGQPLNPATRAFMEPRFGVDFAAVRIHTDDRAQRLSAKLNADAFTLGNDIFFAPDKWDPHSASGRRLIAHELAHTVQQSRGGPTIQRFVPCTRARMSLEECPRREPGEKSASRREPSIVIYITSPEVGYLITNFDIGERKLKASAKLEPHWSEMIQTITKPGSKWELLGLSDCHGAEQRNRSLRQQRADAVRAALPPTAAAHIVGAGGASLQDCITDNSTRHHRAWNRAVLITAVEREMNFEPEEVEGKRPPVQEADTEDCDQNQQDALTRALGLAKRMVQAALVAISDESPLLLKYFGKDALGHRFHIKQNFSAISKGLKEGPTFQCEEADSWWCDEAHARVIPIAGEDIHICPSAINLGDDFLARTIVHEAAHRFAWIFIPDDLCAGGSSSMDTEDAEDNADCYGEFAGDALSQSP